MTTNPRYYQASGDSGILAPIMMALAGCVTALVLGTLYGVLTFLNPFIYVNFLGTLGLGMVAGLVVDKMAYLCHSRNRGWAIGVGLLAAAVAQYANWIGWTLSASEFEVLVVTATGLIVVAQTVAVDGIWSMFGWTPTGWQLFLIWTVEAGIIFFCCLSASCRHLWIPYCERCRKWTQTALTVSPLAIAEDPAAFTQYLEKEEYGVLSSLAPQPDPSLPHMKVEIRDCPTCEEFTVATFGVVATTTDDKGNQETREVTFCENLRINTAAFEALKRLQEPPSVTPADSFPCTLPQAGALQPQEAVE